MKKQTLARESAAIEASLLRCAQMGPEEVLKAFCTTRQGLAATQAARLLASAGPNQVRYGKPKPWYVRLLFSFLNPFSIVLLLVAAVSFLTEVWLAQERSWATVIVILALVGISGIMQFVQELRSSKAAEKLKAMVTNHCTALRDGAPLDIPMADLVPGDVVELSSGDMVPADVRLLACKDLFVSESALTGESAPVEKHPAAYTGASLLEATDIGFMGTNVVSGSGAAVVVATGAGTYFSTIAKALTAKKPPTSFEKGVADISRLLLRLILVMLPIILVVNGLTKHDWVAALLFALSVAVGIAPELLPVITTSTLAKGAVAMAKKKTIIKSLSAIQSFGAMDVLCTDKTGTLTEDMIVLEKYLDVHGGESMRVWHAAYLNSYFQTGLKNLIDHAIIDRAEREGHENWDDKCTKVDEMPFDFSRRRMSVVLEDGAGRRRMITKGAVEETLAACGYAEHQGQVVPLTAHLRQEVLQITDKLSEEGLRVVAVAQKDKLRSTNNFTTADECDMVLIGYVGFLDPPKKSSKKAIAALSEHGVRVMVLTGDSEKVARTVCGKVGLDASHHLLGSEIEAMTDEELGRQAQRVTLFAKLSPAQKLRVVRLLQAAGHTVGYLGDGINDAPALNQADVGISVDSGVDIAKESADIILLEKSLMVLEEGVVEGRRTFGNIIKYIKMSCSGNFGNMISVLVSSIFLPFLPMLPIQVLAQNLLYDFSQITIPFDSMDKEYLLKPHKWEAKNVSRFMFWFGPVSSLFDIMAYLVLYFIFKANSVATQAVFQTGWFMVGLLTQTLIVHLIRTEKLPFIQSRARAPVVWSTIAVCAAGILIPFTRLGAALGMAGMPLLFFPWLAGIILLYAATVQLVKRIYIKRYGQWL